MVKRYGLDTEYKNIGMLYQKGLQTMVIQLSQRIGTNNGQLYRDVSYEKKKKQGK
jgi:hypothetical protein